MPSRIRKREPSGRPSRAEAEDAAISPTAAKRLMAEAARDVSRAEYGTELGRLFMAAKLTPAQYQAGHRWHAHVEEWYRAIGAPFPHEPPGPIAALGTVGGISEGEDPPVGTREGKRILERRRRVMDQMHRADAVLAEGGTYVKAVVRLVCEGDTPLAGHSQLLQLRDGLDRLAKHWRMTK